MKNNNKIMKGLTPVQKISLSFLFMILIGSILLVLPISNHGEPMSYIDALFIACSGTCVTGLSTVTVAKQLTVFGKIVLLILIQIGGLGLMTLVASVMLILKNKLSLYDKIALKTVLNVTNMDNFRNFLRGIIAYVASWELLGTFFLSLYFVPKMGFKGLCISLFTSVSAFCNAGFDLFGSNSVISYQDNPIVILTLMVLIVMGGIGFIVWFDIRDKLKLYIKDRKNKRHATIRLTLHTKLVLIANVILIFIPAIMFFILEFNNPNTFGNMSLGTKIMNALFHSVTLRTAGFASVDCGLTTPATQLLMYICMFIGGSPGGTAGGVKTTTIVILLISLVCYLKGKTKIDVYKRHISRTVVVQATNLVMINIMVLFIGIFLLSITESFGLDQIIFEGVSALATVGLSMGITSGLSVLGKVIIIFMMYFGRIGITTFIYSIVREDNDSDMLNYPEGNIIVG